MDPKIAPVEPCHELNAVAVWLGKGEYYWNFIPSPNSKPPLDRHDFEQAMATRLFQFGEYGLSTEHYKQALKIRPHCKGCWFNLGNCYLAREMPMDAAVHYQCALAENANFPSAVLNLGVSYLYLSRRGLVDVDSVLAAIHLFRSIERTDSVALMAKLNEFLALKHKRIWARLNAARKTLELYVELRGQLDVNERDKLEASFGDYPEVFRKVREEDPDQFRRKIAHRLGPRS
jgi:tetratricopeptide (TPR) repeat protein